MDSYTIFPSKLNGTLTVPSSKSHTMRAIIFAALAEGTSHIEDYLPSPDTTAMIEAVRHLGAVVTVKDTLLEIKGTDGKLAIPEDVIQCGNSGLVFRLIGALAGLIPGYTILTGDASIRHNRPVAPLISALEQLGAYATLSRPDRSAPIIVKGPFTKDHAVLGGQDSQPVSGLLIAGAFGPHPITLEVVNPGEKPWIDVTLDWLKRLSIPFEMKDYTHYRVEGNSRIKAFSYRVPGDFSTAAFPIVAALITGSSLKVDNIDMSDCQGDKKVISLLKEMGASIHYDEKSRTLAIESGSVLKGMDIDVNDCIDALPILAVAGCFAKGSTTLYNGRIARNKESDRIRAITQELKKMGAAIEEREDGVTVERSRLHGARLSTYNDHRMALALTVAGLAADSPAELVGTDCIAKTYPGFHQAFTAIGARLER